MMLNANMLSIVFVSWSWKVEKRNFSFEKKSFFLKCEMRACLLAQMRCSDRWKILKLTHLWLFWEKNVYVFWKNVKIIVRNVKISKKMWTYHDSKNINSLNFALSKNCETIFFFFIENKRNMTSINEEKLCKTKNEKKMYEKN